MRSLRRGTPGRTCPVCTRQPAAVSQQLAVLEKEVGALLLRRRPRRAADRRRAPGLTQHARVLLSAAEAASADLASVTGEVRGTVRPGGLQSQPGAC